MKIQSRHTNRNQFRLDADGEMTTQGAYLPEPPTFKLGLNPYTYSADLPRGPFRRFIVSLSAEEARVLVKSLQLFIRTCEDRSWSKADRTARAAGERA